MDVAALKPGEPFDNLPDSFVIFICTFDPFGRGRYCYTYREICDEDGAPLNDGTVKIFLSTKGGRMRMRFRRNYCTFLGILWKVLTDTWRR